MEQSFKGFSLECITHSEKPVTIHYVFAHLSPIHSLLINSYQEYTISLHFISNLYDGVTLQILYYVFAMLSRQGYENRWEFVSHLL